jgi:hypothetical protein
MIVLFSKADWLLMLWDTLWGGLIACVMFLWGRRYERKLIEREKEPKWFEPKEPTL